jgi:hypothetical protein
MDLTVPDALLAGESVAHGEAAMPGQGGGAQDELQVIGQ